MRDSVTKDLPESIVFAIVRLLLFPERTAPPRSFALFPVDSPSSIHHSEHLRLFVSNASPATVAFMMVRLLLPSKYIAPPDPALFPNDCT